jgi:hypothetical protein
MIIKKFEVERSSIENFADKHLLVMEVHERSPHHMGGRWSEDSRYFAHFEHAEIQDGSCLVGTYGNGATPESAIAAYAQEISGKLLVVNAGTRSRIDIRVPILETSCKQD